MTSIIFPVSSFRHVNNNYVVLYNQHTIK